MQLVLEVPGTTTPSCLSAHHCKCYSSPGASLTIPGAPLTTVAIRGSATYSTPLELRLEHGKFHKCSSP